MLFNKGNDDTNDLTQLSLADVTTSLGQILVLHVALAINTSYV
jgi:hypothetical protein